MLVGIFNHVEAQQSLRDALRGISSEYSEFNFDSHPNINEIMLSRADSTDVIFMQLQRAGVVKIETLRFLREKGIQMFNFTGDVRQPVPQWYLDTAPYVTTLFTNLTDAEYLRSKGFDAEYFQIGYNTEFYNTKDYVEQNAPKIVFFGNNYGKLFPLSQFRRHMVESLQARYGSDFGVYGNGWNGAENLNANQKKEGAVYRGCKIAINLSHFNLKRYSSDRMFRILGSGAFCLTHRFEQIEDEWELGKHLVAWDDVSHLFDLIDYYLLHENQTERIFIARNGNAYCEKEFTWERRMKQLQELIKKVEYGKLDFWH